MDVDLEVFVFFGAVIGLFVVLPVCIYFGLKYLFADKTRRLMVNIAAVGGIGVAIFMALIPILNPPTHPGGLGALIFVPLGGVLAVVCGEILFLNNRTKNAA